MQIKTVGVIGSGFMGVGLPHKYVFSAKTSAISITRIGSVTKPPEKVIVIHFIDSTLMKKMVEIIRGYHKFEETIKTAKKMLFQIKKDCIIVKESPGLVYKRVLMLTINEAIFILEKHWLQLQKSSDFSKSISVTKQDF